MRILRTKLKLKQFKKRNVAKNADFARMRNFFEKEDGYKYKICNGPLSTNIILSLLQHEIKTITFPSVIMVIFLICWPIT